MRHAYRPSTPAEMYDRALHYAHDSRLPRDYPRPHPTAEWPAENIRVLEEYCEWLRAGGASPAVIRNIYLPMAGHALGLALKPHPQLDLDVDLQRGLDFLKAKQMSAEWTGICRCSMLKFRRFLAHQRGQIENKTTPYEFKRDTQGLPAWLVNELERFQHVQQRNWREARLDQQIRSFWIVHLRVWRFLREQYGVRELADVKRKHLLDFTDQRLKDEYAASTINTDLRTFQGFLKFLQQEGYAIPQSLLGHKSVRTTELYVHLSNTHLQAAYDRAMSQKRVTHAVNNKAQCWKQTHAPSPKSVNWNGYLSDLPNWLADLMRDFGTSHLQAHDPIQQTRNRLCQLSKFFCWMHTHKLSCLSDITPRIWFTYVEARLELGTQPTSLNTALRTLRSFLKLVETSEYDICARMLEVRPLKTGEALPRDVSRPQLKLLLEQANHFDAAWILLMAHSGLRTHEIRALEWQDIDIEHRTVLIEQSKNLRSRVIFLSDPTLKALNQLPKSSKYVFAYNNHLLSQRYCQSRLKTLGKRA